MFNCTRRLYRRYIGCGELIVHYVDRIKLEAHPRIEVSLYRLHYAIARRVGIVARGRCINKMGAL